MQNYKAQEQASVEAQEQAQKQAQVSTTAGQEERNPAAKTEQKLHDQVSL